MVPFTFKIIIYKTYTKHTKKHIYLYCVKDEIHIVSYLGYHKDYIKGETQSTIKENLKKQGQEITSNTLSNFFRDPFYAGMNGYGNLVVDMSIDPNFEPMVSPSDFLGVQRMNRGNPRGWKNGSDFRPLNDLIICVDCNKTMTAGVSAGHKERYLSVTCGNSKCKEKRKTAGIKPLSNTIRGQVILDFAMNFIKNDLHIEESVYKKAKKEYFESRNSLIKENNEREIKYLKT